MHDSRVLLVDDEVSTLNAYGATLAMNGYEDVLTESDSRRVMDILAVERVDAVVLDLFMPHLSGMELLKLIKERYPWLPVVVVTAADELVQAIQCMKIGAFDYLTKPIEGEHLVATLRKALEWMDLTAQVDRLGRHLLEDRLNSPDAFADIVTRSRRMQTIFRYVEAVARSNQPILIGGESGTGKELVVRSIHRLSGCRGELVSINVAGLDDTMFADALFGHRRGAFSGAVGAHEGVIARAAGGLLFLDEIGDLREPSQIRILRLIQEREYYPLGSDQPRTSDARIVCATNRDLKGLVAAGLFRNDLFYRLNFHNVTLPPLRERREDISLLVDHFVQHAVDALGLQPPSYPRELLDLLATYHFPGNIRELQGMVLDAVARSRGGMLSLEPFRRVITGVKSCEAARAGMKDIDRLRQNIESVWGHIPTLLEAEDCLIDIAMNMAGGNQGIAATMLGLKRQTLNVRLKVRKNRC